LRAPAAPEAIVARVLRNLINAYHLSGDRQASQFMFSLAEDLRGGRPEGPDAETAIAPGEGGEGPAGPSGGGAGGDGEEGPEGPDAGIG
jgi:hypothetical protein